MPIAPAICPNCNTIIQVNDATEASVCPACQAPFITHKAINQYNVSRGVGNGNLNTNIEMAIRDLYKNARALIMNGACVQKNVSDCYITPEDQALQVSFVKMLGLNPNDDRMLILRAANAISVSLRSYIGVDYDDINKYLSLMYQKDRELYMTLLNMVNKRRPKSTNYDKRYSGGLLRMKVTYPTTREDVDKCFAPEEGMDFPFLIDRYYCLFWRRNDKEDPVHNYMMQRIFATFSPDWQNWFNAEFQRRSQIKRNIIDALYSGNYRRAYEAISSASETYPSLSSLLKHFQKTMFSYKCSLSMDPISKSINKYAPDMIHDVLGNCPSMVAQIENL